LAEYHALALYLTDRSSVGDFPLGTTVAATLLSGIADGQYGGMGMPVCWQAEKQGTCPELHRTVDHFTSRFPFLFRGEDEAERSSVICVG
jgi:hypothetical protein